jgi:cation diffusion facilitator family transporter
VSKSVIHAQAPIIRAISQSTAAVDPDSDAGPRRTATLSLLAAVVLVVLKLGTGLASGSLALVSAGIESSGDVIAAVLTLGAVALATRPADAEHNYGHRRAENIAALGEAAIVFVGGCIITFEAIKLLIDGGHHVDTGWYVFAVIAIALSIDAGRIVVSLRAARQYSSAAFRSNAFNFAGDLAGSVAVLVGMLLVAVGFGAGDAIASLCVAAVIFAAVTRLAFENVRALMDYAPPVSREAIIDAITDANPAIELRRLRLRDVAGRLYADVIVGVPPATAASASHDIADRVEAAVQEIAPDADVLVHAEPAMGGADLREQILATALADPAVGDAHNIRIYIEADDTCIVTLHLKLNPEISLQNAHEVSERVETAVARVDPKITIVYSHLEPLEAPVALRDAPVQGGLAGSIERILGHPPARLDIRQSEVGPVALLTITTDPGAGLAAAHMLASDLERELRIDHPELADVVVHTEPGTSDVDP